MNTLITILSFAFVLGVLVFVHELGHFLAAKRVGIRVLKFQLGFNPTILSVKRGDTEYGLGALPLGGYVKMAGDNPDEARTVRRLLKSIRELEASGLIDSAKFDAKVGRKRGKAA